MSYPSSVADFVNADRMLHSAPNLERALLKANMSFRALIAEAP